MDVSVKVRVFDRNGQPFLGPGPVELLRRIERLGSIRRAASEMEMSYMKALRLVNDIEASVNQDVIRRRVGGPKGGGSELTPVARSLIEAYEGLAARVLEFSRRELSRTLGRKIGKRVAE